MRFRTVKIIEADIEKAQATVAEDYTALIQATNIADQSSATADAREVANKARSRYERSTARVATLQAELTVAAYLAEYQEHLYRESLIMITDSQRAALNEKEAAYNAAPEMKRDSALYAWCLSYVGACFPGLRNKKGRAAFMVMQGLTPHTAPIECFQSVVFKRDGKLRKDGAFKAAVEDARNICSGGTGADKAALVNAIGAVLCEMARVAKGADATAGMVKLTDTMIANALMDE